MMKKQKELLERVRFCQKNKSVIQNVTYDAKKKLPKNMSYDAEKTNLFDYAKKQQCD